MTAPLKPDPMDVLMDAYLAELCEMSDEDVLDGKDPESVLAAGMQLLDSARAKAGQRRLAVARQKLHAKNHTRSLFRPDPTVSALEARMALRRAAAVNDGRYTLAARQLDEMSDDDVIRAYVQLQRLESEEGPDGSGSTE
jgi:hypothetical protein